MTKGIFIISGLPAIPGEGWSRVTNFVYNSNSEHGWVALDPFSSAYFEHQRSQSDAESMNQFSVGLWNAFNSMAGAGDSVSPAGAIGRWGYNRFFGIDSNIATNSTAFRAGWWLGLFDQTVLGAVAGGAGAAETGVETAAKNAASEAITSETTPVFQRVMSNAELEATQETGLLRGGRDGTNFFTNAASSNAKRAQIRLGLDGPLRDQQVTFRILNNVEVVGPETAPGGLSGTPGGGLQFFTNRSTQIQILSIKPLKK